MVEAMDSAAEVMGSTAAEVMDTMAAEVTDTMGPTAAGGSRRSSVLVGVIQGMDIRTIAILTTAPTTIPTMVTPMGATATCLVATVVDTMAVIGPTAIGTMAAMGTPAATMAVSGTTAVTMVTNHAERTPARIRRFAVRLP